MQQWKNEFRCICLDHRPHSKRGKLNSASQLTGNFYVSSEEGRGHLSCGCSQTFNSQPGPLSTDNNDADLLVCFLLLNVHGGEKAY